jgi:hypothetical protein
MERKLKKENLLKLAIKKSRMPSFIIKETFIEVEDCYKNHLKIFEDLKRNDYHRNNQNH